MGPEGLEGPWSWRACSEETARGRARRRASPYLAEGQAATVMDMMTKFNDGDRHGKTSGLAEQQLKDLAEYVLSQ